MSGDYVESLATYAEAYGPPLHHWPISRRLLLEVACRHDDTKELVRTEVSTDDLYVHHLHLGRALVTASEGRRDQALSHLRAGALAAELADGWPLGR